MALIKISIRRIQRILLSMVGAAIVGYFLYYTIQGDRGWFAMLRLQREVEATEATLMQIQKERDELQHRTSLLRSDSLDPDLLDEKSRQLLNYSRPDEVIVIETPPSATLPVPVTVDSSDK